MTDGIVALLVVAGAFFSLLASVGMLRLPDLFSRLQAAAKAGTAGTGLLLLAVALWFGELGVATRSLLAVLFLFLTTPVAAHMIARAAYLSGVPLWRRTVRDEMRGSRDDPPRQVK